MVSMAANLTETQTEDLAYRLFAAAIPGLPGDDRGIVLTLLYGGEWGAVIDTILAFDAEQSLDLPAGLLADARAA